MTARNASNRLLQSSSLRERTRGARPVGQQPVSQKPRSSTRTPRCTQPSEASRLPRRPKTPPQARRPITASRSRPITATALGQPARGHEPRECPGGTEAPNPDRRQRAGWLLRLGWSSSAGNSHQCCPALSGRYCSRFRSGSWICQNAGRRCERLSFGNG